MKIKSSLPQFLTLIEILKRRKKFKKLILDRKVRLCIYNTNPFARGHCLINIISLNFFGIVIWQSFRMVVQNFRAHLLPWPVQSLYKATFK